MAQPTRNTANQDLEPAAGSQQVSAQSSLLMRSRLSVLCLLLRKNRGMNETKATSPSLSGSEKTEMISGLRASLSRAEGSARVPKAPYSHSRAIPPTKTREDTIFASPILPETGRPSSWGFNTCSVLAAPSPTSTEVSWSISLLSLDLRLMLSRKSSTPASSLVRLAARPENPKRSLGRNCCLSSEANRAHVSNLVPGQFEATCTHLDLGLGLARVITSLDPCVGSHMRPPG